MSRATSSRPLRRHRLCGRRGGRPAAGRPGRRPARASRPRPTSSGGTTATPTIAITSSTSRSSAPSSIGNGNVALDVARMLSLSHDELRTTDIADHALHAHPREPHQQRHAPRPARAPCRPRSRRPSCASSASSRARTSCVDPADLALDDRQPGGPRGRAPRRRRSGTWPCCGSSPPARATPAGPRRSPCASCARPVAIVGDGRAEGVVAAVNELVASRGRDARRAADGPQPRPAAGGPRAQLDRLPRTAARGTAVRRRSRRGPESTRAASSAASASTSRAGSSAARAGSSARTRSAPRRPSSACWPTSATRPRRAPLGQATADWLHERQPRLVTGEHWAAIDAHERRLGAPALPSAREADARRRAPGRRSRRLTAQLRRLPRPSSPGGPRARSASPAKLWQCALAAGP